MAAVSRRYEGWQVASGSPPTFVVFLVLALNSAHDLALNTTDVLRLSKADVLALSKAHVLRFLFLFV